MNYDGRRMADMRNRYLTEAIETATPAGRLIMLFDALEQDLARAAQAFEAKATIKEISDLLIHAQDILMVLRETIDVENWEPAARIQALYDFWYSELVKTNLEKSPSRIPPVAEGVHQLAAAWREAATRVDAPAAMTTSGS
jgi:flagellar protein FliS